MRATGAYLAGFGTAGSLLACAAVVFVIAAGVVAFQGWPNPASPTGPASVQLELPAAGATTARSAPALHRVTISRPAPLFVHRALPVLALMPSHRSRRRPRLTGALKAQGTGSVPIVGTGGATATGGATVINLSSTSDTGGVGAPSATSEPGRVVSRVTAKVGKTVSTVGSKVGSAVGGTAGTAVGGTAGTGVSGAAGSAGSVVTSAGNAAAGAVNTIAAPVGAGASSLLPAR